jgi:ABC-2 type transport system permease protein
MPGTLTARLKHYWRSFSTSTWLGWQIESNWADPFLFAVYSLIKPLASALILVVMYGVITLGDFSAPLFSYIYVGNACYIFVGRILNGLAWTVIDDREHYKTLKYIYVAPVHFPTYLLGRGIANFLIGLIAVVVTLVFGVAFLDVQIQLSAINWPLLLVSLILGVNMIALLGLILAGVMLLLAHHMWGIGEAVAGALYLFSGAIFPLEVLPAWLRWIGYLLPITYWLELMRRALVGSVAEAFPTFANLNNVQLLGLLLLLTAIFGLVAVFSFRWCEEKARERGLIDVVTNY